MFVCCAWSIAYTRGPLGLSSMWVASGVLCGVLLTSPRALWPLGLAIGFAASLAANALLHGINPLGVALSMANTLEPWLVATVVARHVDDPSRLAQIQRSVLVATLATLVACGLSGLLAAVAREYWSSGHVYIGALLATWFASHGVGMTIFATLTISARVEGVGLIGEPGRRLELAATLALLTAICLLVFSQSRLMTYWIFPPLLLCIFRHRFSGFVLGTAVIAVVATMQTVAGSGPFTIVVGDVERTLQLQAFLVCVCLVAFPMAAALTERRLLVGRAQKSERDYRLLADHSADLVGRFAEDGTRLYISPSVADVLGWKPEDVMGPMKIDWLHPDDRHLLDDAFREVFQTGRDVNIQHRVRHRDGRYLWLDTKLRRVRGLDDCSVPELVYVARDVTRRVEAEQAVARLARHDSLTGLGNRLHFGERLDLAMARYRRSGQPLAVLYMDVDRFKQINDTHGHAAGDIVLREFAERLRGCVRHVDFPARLGGDEFVVLVEDLDTPEVPQTIAEKLIASIGEPIDAGAATLRVTASIGIAVADDASLTPDELLNRADAALYRAKQAGRNTWRTAG
ncbi:MAG: diguanylate cyclase [Proteobacteria bacterium]|nr:diguanylate cyclase [Pseudomonadota bacterium]